MNSFYVSKAKLCYKIYSITISISSFYVHFDDDIIGLNSDFLEKVKSKLFDDEEMSSLLGDI